MKAMEIGPRERRWRDQLKTGSVAEKAEASLRLGKLLIARGNHQQGIELLRSALQGPGSPDRSKAAWALAQALFSAGMAEQAAIEFRGALDSIEPDEFAPEVTLAIASRIAALGHPEAATSIYRDFIDGVSDSTEDRRLAAIAAFRLAEIHAEDGFYAKAVRLLHRAIRDGSRAVRTHAMSNLADLLKEAWMRSGEESAFAIPGGLPSSRDAMRETSELLYQQVVETDHADLAPRSAYLLAELHQATEDWISAEACLTSVALSGHAVYAPLAEKKLCETEHPDTSYVVEQLLSSVFANRQQPLPQAQRISCRAAQCFGGRPLSIKWGSSLDVFRPDRPDLELPSSACVLIFQMVQWPESDDELDDLPTSMLGPIGRARGASVYQPYFAGVGGSDASWETRSAGLEAPRSSCDAIDGTGVPIAKQEVS